ncbi:MAG: hypothetical protein AUG44_03425 [Actinobacteria bacterium 13_1_20CM_3_71_11]|nr:MAG: hypothetical protein AUG44_03425 [Actinobacteria bacterium 13_1_20CM_3_71_11]
MSSTLYVRIDEAVDAELERLAALTGLTKARTTEIVLRQGLSLPGAGGEGKLLQLLAERRPQP